jgi:hypothetical protein
VPRPRKRFYIGQVIGNGFIVRSLDRVKVPTNIASKNHILGIRVTCHCGRPFVVLPQDLAKQKSCGCSSKRYRHRASLPLPTKYPPSKHWLYAGTYEFDLRVRAFRPLIVEALSAFAVDPGYLESILWDARERAQRATVEP